MDRERERENIAKARSNGQRSTSSTRRHRKGTGFSAGVIVHVILIGELPYSLEELRGKSTCGSAD